MVGLTNSSIQAFDDMNFLIMEKGTKKEIVYTSINRDLPAPFWLIKLETTNSQQVLHCSQDSQVASISFKYPHNQQQMKGGIITILVCAEFMQILSQTPINISANYKYAYSGKYVIDISSQISATNSTNWEASPAEFTVSYPKSLAGTDVLVDPIISDFSLDNVLSGINAIVYLQQVNGTFMTFYFYTNNANNIKKISISYVIFFNNITYVGNFAAYKYNLTVGRNISKTNPFLGAIVLPTIINNTGGVSSFGAIAGFSATPTNTIGTISIITTFAVISQSQLGFSISSLANDPTYVKQMSYVILLYNQGYYNYSDCNIFNGQIEQTFSNYLSYSSSVLQMQQFNTYVGLTSFDISNQSSMQLFLTLDSPSVLWANSSHLYNYLTVSYLVFYWKYCDFRNPYLNIVDNLCYLNCPGKMSANDSSLHCMSCLTDCGSQTSSDGFPIYAIVLISIFGGGITIIIFAIICLKYRKRNHEPIYKQTKNLSNPRKIIEFKRPQSQFYADLHQIAHEPNKPQFHPIPSDPLTGKIIDNHSMADLSHKNLKERVSIISPQWRRAEQNITFEQTCFCSRDKPYLRCGCKHNFHLTCLLDWLVKDKMERRCPLCRQQIPAKAQFYCFSCRQYYKIIDLDSFNEDRKRLQTLQVNCKQCPI